MKSEKVREIGLRELGRRGNSMFLGELVRICRDEVEGWYGVDLVKLRVRVVSSLSKSGSGFRIYKLNGRVLVSNDKLNKSNELNELNEYVDFNGD